jgi:hypothetical protein
MTNFCRVNDSMSSKSLQPLIRIDEANVCLATIDDALNRSLVANILAEIERFYSLDPSGLETPCDLAFVCKVLDYGLKDALDLLQEIVNEALYWSDELPRLTVAPVEPDKDNPRHSRRIIQAENYCALHPNKWMAAVLMGVLSDVGLLIRATGPGFRYNPGPNRPRVPADLPAEPLDCLFLVRALDCALRPGGPVRTLIHAHEPGHAKRSEGV